jgi:DNA helicase HerA-like ATPase
MSISMSNPSFSEQLQNGYQVAGAFITLGAARLDNQLYPETPVKLALSMFNRHGLIAGATGTGKTKSLQVLAEQLSLNGVPTLLMDIKGDLSGLGAAGETKEFITKRSKDLHLSWNPTAFPVDFLSLSEEPGARLRSTLSEFGPVLFSRILDLNDTQGGLVALAFKYCDDRQLPLVDLDDFKTLLQYLNGAGKAEVEKEYGKISSTSLSTILRKIIELEQQGAAAFLGERSFDVADLMRKDASGKGIIHLIRLTDLQDRPKLFSTFMLSLLSELYQTLPEKGDADKPELVIFIDEAHLLFKESTKALLDQLESIIKLIRSKGVGIYFCTQSPTDVPAAILGQLGLKIQHALRAFTAKDRKDIKLAAENFPITEYFDTATLLTSLGIGEALVSGLSEKGIPTPLVPCVMRAPESRMGILTDAELNSHLSKSTLVSKYAEVLNRESAHEKLQAEMEEAAEEQEAQQAEKTSTGKRTSPARKKSEKSAVEKTLGSPLAKEIGRTVTRELTRGLLGVLGLRKR